MSLDSNGNPIKRSIQEYTIRPKSTLFTATSVNVEVILTLDKDEEGFNKYLYVSISKEDAIGVVKILQSKGKCLLINKFIGTNYNITDLTYVKQYKVNLEPVIRLVDENLYFEECCVGINYFSEYMMVPVDLYDVNGKIVGKDILVNYNLLRNSYLFDWNLIYNKDGENIECYPDGNYFDIRDRSNLSYMDLYRKDVIPKNIKFIPCTDYDRGTVYTAKRRDNIIVELTFNTGDTFDVTMSRSNAELMACSIKPKEVISIDNMLLVVVKYVLKKESKSTADCYYDETGLHLIRKKDTINFIWSNLYRLELYDDITVDICSDCSLGDCRCLVIDNKIVSIKSLKRLGNVNFISKFTSKDNRVACVDNLYSITLSLAGKMRTVNVVPLDFMLMKSSNKNFLLTEDEPSVIDSYTIDATVTRGFRVNVAVETFETCNVLRFFPENK